ncbi:MAG TPA: hypothetical protein VI072_32280 [Polyangiaceae bacterium]
MDGVRTPARELSAAQATGAKAQAADAKHAAFIRLFERPRLALELALIAVLLSAPALFIGFHLDDYVGLYIYSDLPGAKHLFELYSGGYALTNGNPADTHWQIEEGWAPWWTNPELLLRLYRPIGVLSHQLDFKLWPNSAFVMHAHNLAWLAVIVLAATRMYRGALGTLVGGIAAALFAFDHTHGFAVGYIVNRHALISAALSILCLDQHIRYRAHGVRSGMFLGPLLYVLSLLTSESSLAVAGYLFAYAALGDRGALWKRALSFLPYLVITVVWRGLYNAAGYGAVGSGLYLDPGREPVRFLLALLERGPILVLGQFWIPPAEAYVLVGPTAARVMLVGAVLFTVIFFAACIPLFQRNRLARFWALGFVVSLVPAATTYPHNRQLFMASIGGMALLAQFWHLYAVELRGAVLTRRLWFSGVVSALVFGAHLLISPLGLPVTTCSVAFAGSVHGGMTSVGEEIVGKTAVFMTAPDYFAVKLVQLGRRIEQRALPRRWRALSFGPGRITVSRTDPHTLVLHYEDGVLNAHFLELYRDRRLAMKPGERIELEGMSIEVLNVTRDGRAERARFRFDAPLDDPSYVFYEWRDDRYARFTLPEVGQATILHGADVSLGLK